jgi:uncharacterized protein (TIGR02679 family)
MRDVTEGPRSKLPEALAPVWRAVHERLSSGLPVSSVTVGPLDDEQRGALADLLGMARLPGERPVVSLAKLDEVLRDAVGADIREVVTELVGPIGDRAGERQRAAAEKAELWGWLERHPVIGKQPALKEWVTATKRAGLIDRSVAKTREELGKVLRVLEELPAAGVPLPVFAEKVLHDTHALDDGTRRAGMVQRALSTIYDVPEPASAQERRALWEQAGVTDDELSSTVLAAGMKIPGDDVAARVLRVCADDGEAAALTLSQVRASTWTSTPSTVWVFENPSMLALAIARFGRDCPPIVVTSGWPSSAGILLLRKLAEAGTRLRYHGDFDGEGLRIAAHVLARTGALPWRMSSADYLGSVGKGPSAGRVTPAPWDDELAAHLERVGIAVSEERVANRLLDALARENTA